MWGCVGLHPADGGGSPAVELTLSRFSSLECAPSGAPHALPAELHPHGWALHGADAAAPLSPPPSPPRAPRPSSLLARYASLPPHFASALLSPPHDALHPWFGAGEPLPPPRPAAPPPPPSSPAMGVLVANARAAAAAALSGVARGAAAPCSPLPSPTSPAPSPRGPTHGRALSLDAASPPASSLAAAHAAAAAALGRGGAPDPASPRAPHPAPHSPHPHPPPPPLLSPPPRSVSLPSHAFASSLPHFALPRLRPHALLEPPRAVSPTAELPAVSTQYSQYNAVASLGYGIASLRLPPPPPPPPAAAPPPPSFATRPAPPGFFGFGPIGTSACSPRGGSPSGSSAPGLTPSLASPSATSPAGSSPLSPWDDTPRGAATPTAGRGVPPGFGPSFGVRHAA